MALQVLRNKVTGLYSNGVSFAEKSLDDASVQKNLNPVIVKMVWGENAEIVSLIPVTAVAELVAANAAHGAAFDLEGPTPPVSFMPIHVEADERLTKAWDAVRNLVA